LLQHAFAILKLLDSTTERSVREDMKMEFSCMAKAVEYKRRMNEIFLLQPTGASGRHQKPVLVKLKRKEKRQKNLETHEYRCRIPLWVDFDFVFSLLFHILNQLPSSTPPPTLYFDPMYWQKEVLIASLRDKDDTYVLRTLQLSVLFYFRNYWMNNEI